jgi:glycosyltransferase involved in cell wall biosynthesis
MLDIVPMPRTVLMLHGSAAGYGADRQLLALATGLDPGRYRPVVVLPEPGRIGGALAEAGIELHCIEMATLRRNLLTGRGAAVTTARLARDRFRVARLAKERGAAIVHTNTAIVLGGQSVASATGAAHVLHVREIFAGEHTRGHRLWPLLRRRLLRADALICVSDAAAGQFGDSARTRVIHDGLAAKPALVERPTARRILDLPADAPVVAMVARISDWKGQHVLAEALALDPLASTGAIGVIAGDAAPGQKRFARRLVGLREQLSLGGRLRLLGFREDVGTVLGAADIFAAPSTYPDSFPNAILEAAVAGLPVVGSRDGGGLAEIARDGETGLLVPPNDAQALAEGLAELLRDPERARSMGAAAEEEVSVRFSEERMLDAVQACYDEVG